MKKNIASPWRRLVANILDTIFFFIIGLIVLSLVYLITESPVLMYLLTLVIFLVYTVLPTYYWGATLGKLALGLRVVKDDGSKLDFTDALIREYTGRFFSSFVLGLGYLWTLFHPHHRGWHDLMADTLVIHIVPEPPKALEVGEEKK